METLNEYEKIKRNLERATSLHSFKKQAPILIRQKVTAYERPVEEMVINAAQKSKYFSKEADIVLLCVTNEQGYGNWSAIKFAIRRDTRVRFDHLFMSRNEQELQKRVDILVKGLEKEQSEPKGGHGRPMQQRYQSMGSKGGKNDDCEMNSEEQDDAEM